MKLSATSYAYNGKIKTPSVTVKDSNGKTLKKDTDYTVKYAKGRKNVGKYKVTVTLKGSLGGKEELYFTIKPSKVTLSSATAVKKGFKLKWKKAAGAVTGYQVQYALKSDFSGTKTKWIKKADTVSTSVKKLKAKKKYYVRIRAYKTVDGKKLYGAWSAVKNIKTK